ncbi:MAG: hypothetical protein ACLGHQ_02790 [Acidimicrobiia bacterium]
MSVDLARAVIVTWVRLYTAGLSRPVAARRLDEIRADLHDQVVHERTLGVRESRIAVRLASRTIRGAAADVTWRAREVRSTHTRPTHEQPTQERAMKATPFITSAARVSAVVIAVLAIPLIGTATSDEVQWSVVDFVLAGTLLGIVGVCIEVAVQRRGNVVTAAALAILGVAAAVLGELDDAPGLVLLGALMVVGGGAIAHRRVRTAL